MFGEASFASVFCHKLSYLSTCVFNTWIAKFIVNYGESGNSVLEHMSIILAKVLTRGKLHIEVMPEDFPGETPEGAAVLVSKLGHALRQRFPGASLPRVIFTDRGKGFFRTSNGKITPEYETAFEEGGFRAFWGQDASKQPGTLQELMLHETTASWA